MSTDPVCGMEVYESTAPSTDFNGVKYFFCSQACLEAFHDHPDEYVAQWNAERAA